ncbi:MAG: LLM class F420-dependent oxidoreductase [Gammaproteobacteria bacterium]
MLKFGGPFPFTGPLATRENIAACARRVEALGYDFVWIGDHLMFPKDLKSKYPLTPDGTLPIDPAHNFLEMFTTFAFLAGQTTRLRFQTHVYLPALRHPLTSARLAASLDYLSGGRLNLVVGLGWMKDEYDVVGIPWSERGARTDEAIQAMRAIFAEQAFKGRFYEVTEAWFRPRPVQDPLPIWVGGDSDAAIRRAARLGDGWAPTVPLGTADPVGWMRGRVGHLRELMDAAGRSYAGFPILQCVGFIGTAGGAYSLSDKKDALLGQIAAWKSVGCTHLAVLMNEQNSHEPLARTLEEAQWFAEEVMSESGRL